MTHGGGVSGPQRSALSVEDCFLLSASQHVFGNPLTRSSGRMYTVMQGSRLSRTKGKLYEVELWKRSAPPPSMLIFDTPNRDLCSVKRTMTSSPLQALLLLNDPQYVEAARVMAEKAILSEDENMDKKLSAIFRKITGRAIKDGELEILVRFYNEEKEKFSKNPSKALAYLKTGEQPMNRKTGIINTAALATVISGMMNTAEAITIN